MISISEVEQLDRSYRNVSGIYMMYSKNTGYIYIGSSINLYKRYNEHRTAIVFRKFHRNYKINKLIHNYNNDLYFQVWEICNSNNLLKREQVYLDMLVAKPISLNINPIAESCLGVKKSPEVVEKTARKLRGRKRAAWVIKKLKKIFSGRGNTNYKDGRCLRKYFCIVCGTEINMYTWWRGSKKCYFCYRKTTRIWNKGLSKHTHPSIRRASEKVTGPGNNRWNPDKHNRDTITSVLLLKN